MSTTSHLANIQAAFFPNSLCRQPVVQLEAPSPTDSQTELVSPGGGAPTEEAGSSSQDEDLHLLQGSEEEDPLGKHLAKVMKREKRKEVFKATMRGIWAFLKTPLGVAAAIYMLLVVVWGAGLVFLLIIPMNSYVKKLWVGAWPLVTHSAFAIGPSSLSASLTHRNRFANSHGSVHHYLPPPPPLAHVRLVRNLRHRPLRPHHPETPTPTRSPAFARSQRFAGPCQC